MKKEKLLMTPGPTMVPHEVLMAEAAPMIHHRTPEYSDLFTQLNKNLQIVFQTKNSVLTYPAVGTGGLEAAVVNFFSPGDQVLVTSIGVFGERVATIAKAFGLKVDKLAMPLGKAVTTELIEERLKTKNYRGIFVTHNETSTGAFNNIKAIGEVIKDKNILFIVDAVSSLGGLELKTDEWGIDVVVTASQKALMASPGLTFLSISDRAFEIAKTSKCPKFYWDVLKAKAAMEKPSPQNPYTPAVSLIRGVNKALELIIEEGLQEVFERHSRLAEATRHAVEALGLKLFATEGARSDVITSIKMPEGIDGEGIKKIMSEKHGVIIAGGQQDLKGKIIRIGHMGYVDEGDLIKTIAALEKALLEVGYTVTLGAGVTAARERL
ncbi:MAG: alanine--glyoxylate aminotransferase family protein [Clostridiaceae bacterium]|nr:alanine--glyoxylate aminotransferase family protein [Clostridiaceae bacterium]